MTIKLPKKMRGFSFDRVLPVELNTFDVDILLPAVFFQVISEGKERGRVANDPESIAEYVDMLAAHTDVEGFDEAAERRTLDRLVRTSLVRIGRKGQTGTKEQILGLTGYTFLAFKPGFPAHTSTLRQVPSLLYRMMLNQLQGQEKSIDFFLDIFGKGVKIQKGAEPNGWYDGHTPLDTLTRLSLAFLDCFKSTGIRKAKEQMQPEACPGLANRMAVDLQRYLQTYRDRMPIEGLTYNLRALINFELLFYSLKLFSAVTELVQDPRELPSAMCPQFHPSLPDVYLDFTGSSSGLSRDMAAACVRRDIDHFQAFIHANLLLRQLDRYVKELRGNRRVSAQIGESVRVEDKGPEYLQAILYLLDRPDVKIHIDALASRDEQEIRMVNVPGEQSDDEDPENQELDQLIGDMPSAFDAVIQLLVEAQQVSYTQACVKWFYSVGGLLKPHGVLQGHLRSRQSWRYGPSNDLLALLVQLAAVQGPRWHWQSPTPQPIRLQFFLEWLYDRFGILIDRPPEGFDGAEHFAAAQENLHAMLRRLRQMGIFRDLSDDFTVQRLTPPYSGEQSEVSA